MENIKIAVAMPCYNDMNPLVSHALNRACLIAERKGYLIYSIGGTSNQVLCRARNKIVEDFLSSDATHLFCIDSDVVIPNHTLDMLVEADKDIITGIYFQKTEPHLPLIMAKGKLPKGPVHHFILEWPQDVIFPIDSGGLGCCLLKKEVFEKVKSPWFEWEEGKAGEDIGFFLKTKKAGIDIFCHPHVLCGHVTSRVIGYEDFKSQNLTATAKVEISAGVFAEVQNGGNIRGQHEEGN